jgi:hypothetical protein
LNQEKDRKSMYSYRDKHDLTVCFTEKYGDLDFHHQLLFSGGRNCLLNSVFKAQGPEREST